MGTAPSFRSPTRTAENELLPARRLLHRKVNRPPTGPPGRAPGAERQPTPFAALYSSHVRRVPGAPPPPRPGLQASARRAPASPLCGSLATRTRSQTGGRAARPPLGILRRAGLRPRSTARGPPRTAPTTRRPSETRGHPPRGHRSHAGEQTAAKRILPREAPTSGGHSGKGAHPWPQRPAPRPAPEVPPDFRYAGRPSRARAVALRGGRPEGLGRLPRPLPSGMPTRWRLHASRKCR